jgi:hypothetical protein
MKRSMEVNQTEQDDKSNVNMRINACNTEYRIEYENELVKTPPPPPKKKKKRCYS